VDLVKGNPMYGRDTKGRKRGRRGKKGVIPYQYFFIPSFSCDTSISALVCQ